MIPNGVARKALGFLFAEYLAVATELLWYFVKIRFLDSFSAGVGVYCCTTYVVLVRGLRLGYVARPWDELGMLGIGGSQDDWQLCVINPSLFPIDSGLYCCEP